MPSNSCLNTTITNISGQGQLFACLGTIHAVYLAPGQSIEVPGDLRALGQSISSSKRQQYRLLEKLMETSVLKIDFPAPIVSDENGDPMMLVANNGAVEPAVPCWAETGS